MLYRTLKVADSPFKTIFYGFRTVLLTNNDTPVSDQNLCSMQNLKCERTTSRSPIYKFRFLHYSAHT